MDDWPAKGSRFRPTAEKADSRHDDPFRHGRHKATAVRLNIVLTTGPFSTSWPARAHGRAVRSSSARLAPLPRLIFSTEQAGRTTEDTEFFAPRQRGSIPRPPLLPAMI